MLNKLKQKEIIKNFLFFKLIQNFIYQSYFKHYCIIIIEEEPTILQYRLCLNSSFNV